MDQVFDMYTTMVIDANDTYIRSYPALLSCLEPLAARRDPHALITMAHTVYGWMPTIVSIYGDEARLMEAASLVDEARHRLLDGEEIQLLASCINNSVVGTSKLLHFTNPGLHPIWDSKVYRCLNKGTRRETPHQHRVNNVGAYLDYRNEIHETAQDPRCEAVRQHISDLCGYEVSPIRAIEMVLFANG